MSIVKITKEKDSLELATKILEKFFLENESSGDNNTEYEKWKKWFLDRSEKFRSGEINNILYFNQITRIRSFLIMKMLISADMLFEVEKEERKRGYDLTQMEKSVPQPFSEEERSKLARTLYDYFTIDLNNQLKINERVESITKKMRDKRFGFSLDSDPNKNIRYIEENNVYSDNTDREKYLLGELFSELGKLEEAEDAFLQVSKTTSQKAGLLKIAVQRKDFNSFQSLLPEAYPESYKPEIYGRYILTFLLGNEKSFKYEIDADGKRYVSYAFSTGVVKIAHIDVFSTFVYDFRVSPDERIGLWLSPTNVKYNFFHEIGTQLDYKEVLGWKNL